MKSDTKFKKGDIPWNKGKKCIGYNQGRPKILETKFCISCNKEICYTSKRCLKCYKESRKKLKKYCVDCQKLLTNTHSLRCHACENSNRWSDSKYKQLLSKKISIAHGGSGKSNRASFYSEYGGKFDSSIREKVRFRDKYKCQLCGCSQLENGKQLDVHHIDYNKKNCDINNLIGLCHSCHAKTNINRKYWINFFKERLLKYEFKTINN